MVEQGANNNNKKDGSFPTMCWVQRTQNSSRPPGRRSEKRKLDEEVASYLPNDSVPLRPPPHTLLPWCPGQTEERKGRKKSISNELFETDDFAQSLTRTVASGAVSVASLWHIRPQAAVPGGSDGGSFHRPDEQRIPPPDPSGCAGSGVRLARHLSRKPNTQAAADSDTPPSLVRRSPAKLNLCPVIGVGSVLSSPRVRHSLRYSPRPHVKIEPCKNKKREKSIVDSLNTTKIQQCEQQSSEMMECENHWSRSEEFR